jgi:excisionase family DNA binding protein
MIKLYTTDEVAEVMKVSPRTIRKEVKSAKLKGVMIRGQIRFREDEIERYLQENSWSYRGRKVSGDTVEFA